MTLLSPLSKDITICSTYACGILSLQNANTPPLFDIIFLAYPARHHKQNDIATKIIEIGLQNGDRLYTIILSEEQLPPQDTDKIDHCHILTKPVTRQKLQDILAPLQLTLPRRNCWEYLECGREPGGRNADSLGICPATQNQAADGIHGGKNAGRVCWATSGTLCGGQVQGSFACKIKNCMLCDFYKVVQTEEAEVFESIDSILNRIRRKNNQ